MNCCGTEGPVYMYLDGTEYPMQPSYLAHQTFVQQYGVKYFQPKPYDNDLACIFWQDGWDLHPGERPGSDREALGADRRAAYRLKADVWLREDPWTLAKGAENTMNKKSIE